MNGSTVLAGVGCCADFPCGWNTVRLRLVPWEPTVVGGVFDMLGFLKRLWDVLTRPTSEQWMWMQDAHGRLWMVQKQPNGSYIRRRATQNEEAEYEADKMIW